MSMHYSHEERDKWLWTAEHWFRYAQAGGKYVQIGDDAMWRCLLRWASGEAVER